MTFPLYNCKFLLLIGGSFIVIFSSIAIYFCLPFLISHLLRSQLTLAPNSGSLHQWQFNSVIDQLYLYNISNWDDIFNQQTGKHVVSLKPVPILKQVGPFTFRQDRTKLNVTFDSSTDTVRYDQKRVWTFVPELSLIKTVEDLNSTIIYHMNVPLAGTTLNAEFAEFIEPIVSEFDMKLFVNHSAYELLFDGYHDILMEQAKAQGHVEVDRFGWMNIQNNSIQQGIRVFTGRSNTSLDKFGAIYDIGGAQQLQIWRNNGSEPDNYQDVKCNDFKYSSAGEFFPPSEYSIISYNQNRNRNRMNSTRGEQQILDNQSDLNLASNKNLSKPEFNYSNSDINMGQDNKVGKTINLFVADLCRSFRLSYNATLDFKGLTVDRYIANEWTYDYTSDLAEFSPQKALSGTNGNKCFCAYNEYTKLTSCPPNGMMDLFNCRKGSPMTISFPHFLYSRNDKTLTPYLKLFEDKVEADEKEHQFFMDLESTLNVPVRAQIVFQFNIHYKNEPSLNFTKDYSFLFNHLDKADSKTTDGGPKSVPSLYLPQMWIKSSVEIDDENLRNLKFIQRHLKLVTPILVIIMFSVASILLLVSAKLAYDLTYGPKMRKVTNPRCSQKREVIFLQLVDDCTSD